MEPLSRRSLNHWSPIEEILLSDPGDRGIKHLMVPGDLARGARSLRQASSCWIVTGFLVGEGRAGETDGPPGARALARALERLSISYVIVSDETNSELMRRAGYPNVLPMEGGPLPARPTHGVVIERPGPARDGRFYTMAGEAMADETDQFVGLVGSTGGQGTYWIGVGDGGNEIGMGKVHPNVVKHVRGGEQIACITATDDLIVAGTSNWGVWGLLAELSIVCSLDLLPTAAAAWQDVCDLVAAGAVDGRTGRAEASVDGLDKETYLAPLEGLRALMGV